MQSSSRDSFHFTWFPFRSDTKQNHQQFSPMLMPTLIYADCELAGKKEIQMRSSTVLLCEMLP